MTISRRSAVLLLLVLGGVALLTAIPTWLTTAGSTVLEPLVVVQVAGTKAAPGVGAGALVVAAAALALGIIGRIGRYVVLLVAALAGAVVAFSALGVVRDPTPVATREAADATGVTELTEGVHVAFWPYATTVVGALVVVLAILVAVRSGAWRTSTRHERVAAGAPASPDGAAATAPEAPAATEHPVADDGSGFVDEHAAWDSLTRGEDPTDDGASGR
ncbi:Trp biosynthesis-associated membrane protein [Luteimicrobium sp. NPDC057192]|uniref:Trp biosynthesis-associated membrane protein n=1 Tax=Luteimicrobium sp. NPDC057192 TaxID=3346042 RepID=UPI00362E99C1